MIRVLDKFISDKIAAGEVIERPVSAVKELVENSIDAGARSVIVEIRGGGKTYIRVTDDGCGIPAEEAETAFLRHATSKISGITDLDNIRSLGFRGEALASIAAVSRITLVTRTRDSSAGVRLSLHGGRVIAKEMTGANTGTTIIAEDLFYNTPARRKFMGTDAREASAVIDLIEQFAICYSDIRFMMVRNGETVFTTQGDGDTLAAIRTIYPDKDHADLIPVDSENVRGYISDPGTARSTRRGQLFFVNGRIVSSKAIEKGLEKGYGGRVFSGYPIAILFIDADPSEIDVNIHPGKREIKFLRQDEIIDRIAAAIADVMNTRESVPHGMKYVPVMKEADSNISIAEEQPSIKDYLAGLRHDEDERPVSASGSEGISGPVLLSEETDPEKSETDGGSETNGFSGTDTVKADAGEHSPETYRMQQDILPADRKPLPFDFGSLIFRGCIFDTYVIMETRDSVYLLDQHAAHERIYYEKFTNAYNSGDKIIQPLLTSFTINVSADVYYTGRNLLEAIRRMGYDIEDFGMGSFVVRGIPAFMSQREAQLYLTEFFDEAASGSIRDVNSTVIDKLTMKSCKAAVKGGERLSDMELRDLLNELSMCENPYSCPHGRPTFVRYTRNDIERSFRRK